MAGMCVDRGLAGMALKGFGTILVVSFSNTRCRESLVSG